MTIRRIAGTLLALLALWLLWQAIEAVLFITALGEPLMDAILSPPIVLWRLIAGGLALAGGLLAALRLRFGAHLALLGTVCFSLLAVMLIAMGADISMWIDEFVFSAIMIVLTGILLWRKRS